MDNGLFAVDPKKAFQLDISGTKVLKIKPRKGVKIEDIYGKVLHCTVEETFNWFIVLKNNRIYPLDRDLTLSQITYLCNNQGLATSVASFKLLRNLLLL